MSYAYQFFYNFHIILGDTDLKQRGSIDYHTNSLTVFAKGIWQGQSLKHPTDQAIFLETYIVKET